MSDRGSILSHLNSDTAQAGDPEITDLDIGLGSDRADDRSGRKLQIRIVERCTPGVKGAVDNPDLFGKAPLVEKAVQKSSPQRCIASLRSQ